ncbi:MAG: 2-amino-4-hydroxy-6-hydroxymethyldihydropteridine diphosphokinase [Spartobacteria bacterium]
MRAGLALGSNIGERLENLRAARKAIVDLAGISPPILASPIYETEPVDCEPGASTFWNAVMEVGYDGDAVELLPQLKQIELAMGRPAEHVRNLSRKIDIDLLYFGDAKIDNEQLRVPHPRMHERKFVLQPLAHIQPELILPGQTLPVRELLAQTEGWSKVVARPEEW